jgi:hypothetical protein
MFLSQYGRFLAYVQCAFDNMLDPTGHAQCDCEKQLPPAVRGDDKELPPPKGMNVAFEEYYLPSIPWRLSIPLANTVLAGRGDPGIYAFTKTNDIFRPPRA